MKPAMLPTRDRGPEAIRCEDLKPGDIWINDPTKWPDLSWGDIYHYLLETPGIYTKEGMKNYRSLEAYNTFVSGWVGVVHYCEENNVTLLKADVKPSWRVNDEPHQPWVSLKEDGTIISAHCNCMAGLGESCSHVAALLFKVEAAVRNGYTRLACTDKPCEWNMTCVKKVKAAPITDIKFYSKATTDKLKKSIRKTKPEISPSTTEQQKAFLARLASHEGPKPVCLSLFKETNHLFKFPELPKQPKLPKSLSTLYNADNENLSTEELKVKCDHVYETINIDKETIDYLCESTLNQSKCPVWHDQRVGRITASIAHSVLHTNVESPAPSVMKSVCYPSQKFSNEATRWGIEKEPDAFERYKAAILPDHAECQFEKAGIRLCSNEPYIGASPDGLVSCHCCGSGVVEIKCPYKFRDTNYNVMAEDKTSCITPELQLKTTHRYYTQVQLQMHVFDCEYCHFVVWTTKSCLISTVLRDNEFIDNMMDKLRQFWRRHCLPELLTHKMVRDAPPPETTSQVFCYCRMPDDGSQDMIGCDSVACTNKWFHYGCAKVKRAPKGKWYCRDCKKQKK